MEMVSTRRLKATYMTANLQTDLTPQQGRPLWPLSHLLQHPPRPLGSMSVFTTFCLVDQGLGEGTVEAPY